MRRLRLILFVLWGTAVFTSDTFAHADLVSAAPPPGSSVETLSEIRLVFSEPITAGSQIQLLQDFEPVAELQPIIDPYDATVLVTAVPPLPDGVYTVQWAVISADGHGISGSYSLGINSTPPSDTPWYLTNWMRVGLLLLSLILALFVFRRWQARMAKRGHPEQLFRHRLGK
jgi:methionine-rich copper-binding protein CopC